MISVQNIFLERRILLLIRGDIVPITQLKSVKVIRTELSSVHLDQSLQMEAEKCGKVIPSLEKRIHLIESAHRLGHFSVEVMFRQLWNEGYWWIGVRKELQEAVNLCIGCLRFNIVREGFHPLQSVESDHPWITWRLI